MEESVKYWKSLKTGNTFDHSKYSNIEEEKWWPSSGPDMRLYLPLPKDEYPYTLIKIKE